MRLPSNRNLAMWACLVSLPVAGLISVHMKQDDNWDLQNYHLYNAFSLLTGRLGRDFWSGSLQTYFSPLIDVPYYLVSRLWFPAHPRLVAFLAGLPYGGAIAAVTCINLVLFADSGCRGLVLAAGATLVGVTGTTVTAEIGTTFGDLTVSVLILPALLMLLASCKHGARWRTACACAGLLAGAATGLKLTTAIYAPAFALTCGACGQKLPRLQGIGLLCLAWLAGFVATYGWWGILLQQHFGSPVFPMFNDLFASPWTTRAHTFDVRYLPRTITQAVFYPFFWMSGQPFVVTEAPLRDARFALADLAVCFMAWKAWRERATIKPESVCLVVFWACSFVVWEATFSILRYAVPLELLTGSVIACALRSIVSTTSPRVGTAVSASGFLLVFMVQKPYDLGRLKHYGMTTGGVADPHLEYGSAVVVVGHPLSFIAPLIGRPDTIFIGLSGPAETITSSQAINDRLRAARAIYVVAGHNGIGLSSTLSAHGIRARRGGCVPIRNPFQADVILCPAQLEPANEGNGQDPR